MPGTLPMSSPNSHSPHPQPHPHPCPHPCPPPTPIHPANVHVLAWVFTHLPISSPMTSSSLMPSPTSHPFFTCQCPHPHSRDDRRPPGRVGTGACSFK